MLSSYRDTDSIFCYMYIVIYTQIKAL